MLLNGKVLIAGGTLPGGVYLASAELFDPSAGKFTAIASMTVARTNHSATMLPNGKVLIAGGYDSRPSGYWQSAELYDPGAGKFTATGSMAVAKSDHTATLLPNGRVLIAGGETVGIGISADAELYDPSVGTFAAAGSMTVPRVSHTTTMLLDGKVLIAGGVNEAVVLASAELYDPSVGTFAATASMVARREQHTATLLPDGKVLIVGWNWSAEVYGAGATGGAADAGSPAATGGAISTGGVPAAGGATGASAMTLAEACTRTCAIAGGLPTCSTTTTECVQNCMATYDNTSALGARWGYGLLGQQYTDMMICIATNFTSSADFVCARQNPPTLNKWAPVLGPSTDSPCEQIVCVWACDDGCLLDCNDSAHGDVDPWLWLSCGCGGP
jgi:hypothetical protein